jgi:hypothetical protein
MRNKEKGNSEDKREIMFDVLLRGCFSAQKQAPVLMHLSGATMMVMWNP